MPHEYTSYNHHGEYVMVRVDLKGKHSDYCACYDCTKFCLEDSSRNCHKANLIHALCVELNMVLPVWECPDFERRLD